MSEALVRMQNISKSYPWVMAPLKFHVAARALACYNTGSHFYVMRERNAL